MPLQDMISATGFSYKLNKAVFDYLNNYRYEIADALYDQLAHDPGITYSENEWQKAASEVMWLVATMYVEWDIRIVDISDPYIESAQLNIARWILKLMRER